MALVTGLVMVGLGCNFLSLDFGSLTSNTSTPTGLSSEAGSEAESTRAGDRSSPGSLQPDSDVVGEDGVRIEAEAGAIASSREVWIEKVSQPERSADDPPGGEQVGGFYHISAGADVYTTGGTDFLVSVPVPEDADPESLRVGVLLPAEKINPSTVNQQKQGTNETGFEDLWILLSSEYDEAEHMMVADLGHLSGQGRTVALFSFPEGAGSSKIHSAHLASPARQQGAGFEVTCIGFSLTDVDCTDSLKTAIEVELEDSYNTYTGLGFPEPRLQKEDGIFQVELRPYYDFGDSDNDSAVCETEPDPNKYNFGGLYEAEGKTIIVCIPEEGATDDVLNLVRHEYFHATQYAYSAVLNGTNDDWVTESTAEAAVESSGTMTRDATRSLRVLEAPLTKGESGSLEYNAQDFWVYVGREWGLGLDFLIDLFQRGASTSDVDAALQADWPGGMTLGDAYWEFARSQAFEYNVEIVDNPITLRDKCEWDPDVIGLEEIVYRYPSPPDEQTFTLEPLSSKMFKLAFNPLPDAAYMAGYDVRSPGGSGLRAVSYEGGVSPCSNVSSSLTENITVEAGQDAVYFLLVSNTSLDAARDVTLSFLPDQAGIEIVEPGDGLTYDEGSTINFLAIASGLLGDSPGTFQLQWSYQDPDGVLTGMGHGENGQYFAYDNLCDGVYQVTATGRNAVLNKQASDTIQVIVNDLGDSNPPPQCAPEVNIVTPGPGATYKVGDTIQLEAVIDDDHHETDDPLYPVTWHANDAGGPIIGRGLKASTKLGEGVDTLYVSYGAASDTQAISVIDTPNQDPEAVIDQPAKDEAFSYADPGAGLESYTVTFRGHGNDPEDGSLPGSSLHWLVREMGSSSWENIGTGSQVSHAFRYQTGITWYVVRLEVYDSEGLMGSMEVEFSIQAPPS